MSVQELIEELKKLPPQSQLCAVRVRLRGDQYYTEGELQSVSWQGNHTQLEGD